MRIHKISKQTQYLQGSFEIKPDQMQVINPAFVMCLIPFFEIVVYPLMKKIGIPTRYNAIGA